MVLIAPNVYARNLSATQRYNDGYSNGAQAAATDSTYNTTCDPTGAYTSGGGPKPSYCNGWANGYTTTWNTHHGAYVGPALCVGQQTTQPSPQPGITLPQNTQSFIGQDFGDLRNVTAGLVNLHTGLLHNEQGVFIPWSKICTQGQGLLVQSCSSLVNSDGTLTPAGDRAVGCIRNGLAAGIAATKVGLSFNLTKSLLGGLAGPLGCGGIVDMNKIQNSNEFQYLLRSVG